jgi:hypothetical protein
MRDLLGAIWALLYEASQHPLSPTQLSELNRLLSLLDEGLSNHGDFSERALSVCLAIRSSGLFDPQSGTPVDRLLTMVDDLRGSCAARCS